VSIIKPALTDVVSVQVYVPGAYRWVGFCWFELPPSPKSQANVGVAPPHPAEGDADAMNGTSAVLVPVAGTVAVQSSVHA
jgi:hypothetical protein